MTMPAAAKDFDNDTPSNWLGATRLLDLEDSKLRLRVLRVTQLAQTNTQKAVQIHDYIKSLPFGCVVGFDHVPAGDVLRSGRGDCHTKGTLFVAMLRCIQIPARLRFVTLPSDFLHGILELGQSTITHAVGEVYLQSGWIQTDSYVTDLLLEAQAGYRLALDKRSLGYGIHAQGNRFWNAEQHAHGQYTASDPGSLPIHDWGVAHDPEHFYADQTNPQLGMGWLTRAKWMLAAQMVNNRVKKLRTNSSPTRSLTAQPR